MKKCGLISVALCWMAGALYAADLKTLDDKGAESFKVSDYDSAYKYWNEGLVEARQKGDERAVARFCTNIGHIYYNRGEYQKAIDNFSEALAIESGDADKAAMGNSYNNIGLAYFRLNDFSKALGDFDQALKIYRALGNKKQECVALKYFGLVYIEQKDYKKAMDSMTRARELAEETGDRYNECSIHTSIGVIYYESADTRKALDHYDRAMGICKEIGDRAGMSYLYLDIGNVHSDRGNYREALDYYARTTGIEGGIGVKNANGKALANMGIAYAKLGDYVQAFSCYERALKILNEMGDRSAAAGVLAIIGRSYAELGQYSKALDNYNKAVAVKRSIGVPVRAEEVHIGDIYLLQKNFPAALEIYRRLNDQLRLGAYYAATSDLERAKLYLQTSLAYSERDDEAESVIGGFQNLARVSERLEDAAAARAEYERAIARIEQEREILPWADRAHFLAAKDCYIPRLAAYEGRCRVAENASDAFYWSENTKARNFIEAIASKTSTTTNIPEGPALTESEIADRMVSLYRQLRDAYRRNEKQRERELQKELYSAKQEQDYLVAQLRQDYPEYAAIQYPQPLKPEEIVVNPGETIIEYEVTGPYTKVFVLRFGQPVFVKNILIGRGELAKLVQTYCRPFNNRELILKGGFAPIAGKKLYDLLLKPIFSVPNLIPKDSKIIIVPDEALGILPFEALPTVLPKKLELAKKHIAGTGVDWPVPTGIRYVGDDYDIAYAQSATALTLARTLKKGEKAIGGIFILADPIFSRSDDRIKGTRLASYVVPEYQRRINDSVSKMMGLGGTREEKVYFERLEKTSELADSVKSIFGNGVVTLTGKDATETTLQKQELSRYKYLLFATHGILDAEVPYIKEPALVLTLLGNGEKEDGYFTMSEVMKLKLKAELVALTACKTGMGKQVSGEGVMGLGRAFQFAGAKNVLMSLWSVSEQSTRIFAETFFRELEDGKTPREALKRARAEIRGAGYGHPFFWAPFILMTD